MRRERTFLNLAIGLMLSLLLHASFVVWGPVPSLPTLAVQESREVEVELREWPVASTPVQLLEARANVEEPLPPAPINIPQDKPLAPPNTEALQQAVQGAITDASPPRELVQLPQGPPPATALESVADPLRIASSLMDALRREPRLADPLLLPRLPEPGRMLAERQELPPLPAVERQASREAMAPRPAAIASPAPNPAVQIKGPAAERRVIFQPPPPSPTIESETEIELRFWLLPNGTVGRVVPLKKADPRLEALAINYLRNWRFNPLPPDVAPDEQWGIIPFKFRIR